MTEVLLRVVGQNASAIRSARETIEAIRGIRVETQEVGTASKGASATIAETARLNVTKAIEQREALRGLVQEYATVAKTAAAGSEEASVANRLWMESNARLAATYDAVGVAAKRAATDAAAASARAREESGVARGFASRTLGVTAFAGGAFIAGAIGGLAIKKALDESQRAQESQAQLQNALRRTGQSWDEQGASIDRYLVVAEKASSFDRIDLRTSLGQLIRSTGDTTKAQQLLTQATDVARGRHISLDAAVRLVTRAYQGSIGSLARVGIHIDAVTTAQDRLRAAHVKTTPEMVKQAKELDRQATATAALKRLDDLYSGSAEAHARTLAGHEEALGNAFTDLSVAVGKAVTPALSVMFDWMAKEVEAATKSKEIHTILRDTFHVLGQVVSGVAGDLEILRTVFEFVSHHVKSVLIPVLGVGLVAALVAVRYGMISLEASMPWTAIIVGAALAAGWVVKHWSTVRHWFDEFWDYMKRTTRAAWETIVQIGKSAVYVMLQAATAGIRGILEVASHLPFVGDKAREALNAINGYLDRWKPDFGKVVDAFGKGGTSAGEAFVNAATSAMSKPGAYVPPHRAGPRGQQEGGHVTGSGVGAQLANTGLTALGVPYQFGGAPSLSSPTDCSGLMVAIFAKNGIRLPRTSEEQYAQAPIKNRKPLLQGDLVFSEGIHPGHVGLYIGGGKVLEDPHTGDHVKVVPLSGFGWNGESARWWGGTSHHHGGGADTQAPTMAQLDQSIAGAPPSSTPAHHAAPTYHGPTGDALIPQALRGRVDRLAEQARKELAAAQAATGDAVVSYYEDAVATLHKEQAVLHDEVEALKRKLHGATGGRRKAIEAEIAKIEGQIKSVRSAVTFALEQERSALESQASTLASNVSSAWSTVQSAILAAFEANTQSMIDAVGKQFFQGGLQTPQEAALAAAQAADTVSGLNDAVAQAQQQLAADTRSGASTDQIAADRAAVQAAQHQIVLYKLQQAAEASRIKADQDYAAAVAKIQKQRQQEEEHLTVDLENFGQGLGDGTETMNDLVPLLKAYGVNLDSISKGSFIFKTTLDDLSRSVRALDGALVDLGELIAKITGKPYHRPHHHQVGASGGGSGGGGGSTGPVGGGRPPGDPAAFAFAGGGLIPGPMIGPEDTVMARVSTGEAVLSRDELRLLVLAATARPAAAPARNAPIYVLGGTKQEVAQALARIVTPAQDRRIGFKGSV